MLMLTLVAKQGRGKYELATKKEPLQLVLDLCSDETKTRCFDRQEKAVIVISKGSSPLVRKQLKPELGLCNKIWDLKIWDLTKKERVKAKKTMLVVGGTERLDCSIIR